MSHPDHALGMDSELLASRMAALGNRTRLAAYRHLVRAGEPGLSVSALQERLEIPASTLSHHLRRLCDVGLVRQERRGTTLLCRADYEVMGETFEWLAVECCIDVGQPGSNAACGAPRIQARTSKN